MRSSTKSFPCSKTLAWTQKDLLLTGFIGSGVSEQGKHSNVQDIGQSRIRTGIVGLFFFFFFFFENWKIKLCHPKQALTTTPEIHNHQIFPIFSAVNGTAFEIGFIWFIDMCTHVSFLQVIALIKLHQESTLLHLRAHRDPIYFLISNITHSSCGKHRWYDLTEIREADPRVAGWI